MSKRIYVAMTALSALCAAGCFFGGEEDSPLPIVPDPTPGDSQPKPRRVVPGLYVGDYSWIDSGRTGFDSELLLDTNGSYRVFWISKNEALYDQRGAWIHRDSSFYFSRTEETWRDGGLFVDYYGIEDDTNSVRNVTDSSFIRREWTPLRQKPYWITYHRVVYPPLRDGIYSLTKTFESEEDTVVYDFSIELKAGTFMMNVDVDSQPNFQADAKYQQVGSFLFTVENRNRVADSTRTYSEWFGFDGAIAQRLQAISDTSFAMWDPPQSSFDIGTWDVYLRKSPSE